MDERTEAVVLDGAVIRGGLIPKPARRFLGLMPMALSLACSSWEARMSARNFAGILISSTAFDKITTGRYKLLV